MLDMALPPGFEALDHFTAQADREFLSRLVRQYQVTTCVEVGCWVGMSTLALAQPGVRVFCVDHWNGNPEDRLGWLAEHHGSDKAYKTFCRNMGSRLNETVFPLKGDSGDVASTFEEKADLIFLDADHRYEALVRDIVSWWPHLRPGGVLCGHDAHLEDVANAVCDCFPGPRSDGTDTPLVSEDRVRVNQNIWWIVKERNRR